MLAGRASARAGVFGARPWLPLNLAKIAAGAPGGPPDGLKSVGRFGTAETPFANMRAPQQFFCRAILNWLSLHPLPAYARRSSEEIEAAIVDERTVVGLRRLTLGPVHPDRVAAVPADRRLAHRVEDAHPGRRRLGDLDDRARMAFIEKIDERPARRVALLADLPAAVERALADLMVVFGPARPVLDPLMAGGEKVAVEARAVAALLDQFQLHVAGIRQCDRHLEVIPPPAVAEFIHRQLLGVEPRADAAHLDPMTHRLVDVADDDPDLAHRPEQAAHGGSSWILMPEQ